MKGVTDMVDVKDKKDVFLSHFERFEKGTDTNSPSWLLPIRKSAISHFAELGIPTTKHEDWLHTNVSPIARINFERADHTQSQVTAKQIAPYTLKGIHHQIVFVNGQFSANLSSIDSLPSGVTVTSLARAWSEDATLLKTHLARHASYEHQAFVALNTALMEDGAFIHVPENTVVESPIQVIHVSTAQANTTMSHPHHLYIVDKSSQATIIELYVAMDGGTYFTNTVTEIVAHENAVVDHYKIVQESDDAYHIATQQIHQYRNSDVSSHTISLSGGIVRNDINTLLDGEGCECTLNGMYIINDYQHVDNHLVVDHAQPHCNSREFFKGVLDGHSKGIFSGRIIVREHAQKTDAKQTNQSLPLSENVQVESNPQLEIFADDVKCTHGATIGQVSDEAIFYLRSRGITQKSAKNLLIHAFVGESIQQIKVDSLRTKIENWVLSKLPQG